jgi:hypothetical protein
VVTWYRVAALTCTTCACSPPPTHCSIEGLKDGWWEFTVEGAIYSPVPSLMALSGGSSFDNIGAEYFRLTALDDMQDPTLQGQSKYMGWVIPGLNRTRVALQSSPGVLTSLAGPEEGIQVGGCGCCADGVQPVSQTLGMRALHVMHGHEQG